MCGYLCPDGVAHFIGAILLCFAFGSARKGQLKARVSIGARARVRVRVEDRVRDWDALGLAEEVGLRVRVLGSRKLRISGGVVVPF